MIYELRPNHWIRFSAIVDVTKTESSLVYRYAGDDRCYTIPQECEQEFLVEWRRYVTNVMNGNFI